MAKTAKKEPYKGAAGYDEIGVAAIIADEALKRRGFVGLPWDKKLTDAMMKAIEGMRTKAEVVAKINEIADAANAKKAA